MMRIRRMMAVMVGCAALTLATGCSGTDSSGGADSAGGTAVTVNDVSEDLRTRLQAEFGEANLMCGMTDPFSGGFGSGPLREGNAVACLYMSDYTVNDPAEIVWVDVLVMMVKDDAYVYSAAQKLSFDQQEAGATEPAPEWMYRDGLTCEQLAAPPTDDTRPGPDFVRPAGDPRVSGWQEEGLTYPQVVYYWFDTDRPGELDPSGEGRPCSDVFDAAEVDALFAEPITVSGTAQDVVWTEPLLTTYQIRSALAEADDMPPRAIQVDCSLAGPVARGSVITCAPRLNSAADASAVVVVNADGGFVVGPSSEEMRSSPPSASPFYYATGLTCEQVREPVTEETFTTEAGMSFEQALATSPDLQSGGLSFFNAMIYAFSTTDASKIEFDDVGWPCTAAYPPEEVAEVTENVQSVNTG
jgi:hypothetical protein